MLRDEPIIIELFFYGFEGVIMGLIMGSQNIMGSDYGSNISEAGEFFFKFPWWIQGWKLKISRQHMQILKREPGPKQK